MDCTIRYAQPQDLNQIRTLITESTRSLQREHYSLNQINNGLELIQGIDQLVMAGTLAVAQLDDLIIGCGGWTQQNASSPKEAELRAFFVSPAFSGMGVASTLLRHCEDACRAIGVYHLTLASTLTGESFYLRNGFESLGPNTKLLASGELFKLIMMQKSLSKRAYG
ncbi:GNAT family N-acetyltransferase [Nitrincola sp. MINF-07-Sa-05]|uniref:GNAT family N-acetyltransferase n=1 Tax=Nitrincola salilacus TaxID=3400273 RepID=UPI0039185050